MKKKTINAVICKKIDEWINSIEDESVKKIAQENVIVSGGSIASMLLQEPVNDYDIYFKTKEACFKVAKYYAEQFNNLPEVTLPINNVVDNGDRISIIVDSAGVAKKGKKEKYEYFETITDPNEQGQRVNEYINEVTDIAEVLEEEDSLSDYHPVFVSENAITLSKGIQLVFRFYGTPEEIHETYDFVHCTNYWTSWNKKVFLNQPALESLMAKELQYLNSKYPICAIIRTRKFIQRGWTINAGQYLKMCYAVSSLDLNNPEVLKDQLTGVDVAYFWQIINILKDKKKEDPEFSLSYGYLATLIDKIF